MSLLSHIHFKGNQEKAVTDSNSAIAVTAGAGSGKTLSLVGRYLHLLEQGYPLRSILAITFTEKAAREMRSRIRVALFPHPSPLPEGEGVINSPRPLGEGLGVRDIDSARIGTIHSLCAEILRSHPAEAGLDPAFEVLEEGLAAALQAEAIESALAWAATDEESVALFEPFKENELREILKSLLNRRLDVFSARTLPESASADFHELRQGFIPPNPRQPKPNPLEAFSASLNSYLATHINSETWTSALATLSAVRATSPTDKLEIARQNVLAHWTEIQQARVAQNWDAVLENLTALRKAISTQGQKNNWDDIESVRAAMKDLREIYEESLKFLAEKSRFALDEKLATHLPAVHRLLNQTIREYQQRKDEKQYLDFDDLEGLAAQLLAARPEVGAELQAELRAVLVDEFQDTNDRQRQIVYALTGFNQKELTAKNAKTAKENQLNLSDLSGLRGSKNQVDLFVVGDSKQSIYRFRSADVTVFRQVQADVQSAGGLTLDLDLTFRAHKPLLENLNDLLAPIMGADDDPAKPYRVPFAPLKAYRQKPVRENIKPPYVEFHLGLGENAEEGRAASAHALAQRLRELHETEGFAWGDMALLFRASSAYAVYEAALEAADIPFVTIAGRGFYDRPEIRDVLNALAAIADPTDDLALVGLLRSPAFALPDAEIYKLRYPNNAAKPVKIFESLKEASKQVDTETGKQENNATRNLYPVYTIITELHSISGRAPAATVLKRFLDLTHYRATLRVATDPNGTRMIRNVDKLLADAHRSRLVNLNDFLAYVQTLRDVGLREGEAPADSASSGAVQLMTVHKAKGLEFPLAVIADASYEKPTRGAKIQLDDGLLLDLRDDDFHSSAWQLATRREDDRDEAEDVRLLYVAATRAKEKLLVSGYVKPKKDGLSFKGWLGKFDFLENSKPPLRETGLTVKFYPADEIAPPVLTSSDSAAQSESPRASDLIAPLAPPPSPADEKTRAKETDPPQRVWRIVSKTKRAHAPAWVVGKLVHAALRRWRFPDDSFEKFMQPFALESGLTDPKEIHAAIQESRRMLERFHAHPLFNEINSAERRHEIPYFLPNERGVIDLLYRVNSDWIIIDFKTDEARSEAEAQTIIAKKEYNLQMKRYAQAVEIQLGVKAKMRLVFLNVKDNLVIFDL